MTTGYLITPHRPEPADPHAPARGARALDVGHTGWALRQDATVTLPAVPHGESHGIVLVGERGHLLYVLQPRNVEYIEAQGNYVIFHSGSSEYISRDTVKRLSLVLGDSGFVRIERSLMINIRAVHYAQLAGHGTFAFTLASGACLRSGARYREEILRFLPLTRRTQPR
ncbi:MAG TPA: LytTR family DNA-binding domain-containing protein [Steroidobacteraceae bacterium]|jgi:DNA-binding LytR/AlgR family response regulator|nr:LytTR family DNA-binding domain-containing protein [Steroidobacteraceae bacterium]